ncbi:alkylation response protein AidB-like acyl-CoA dehydrogenase [Pseudonocardia eucalypti]|uniref:acyl-CoA dehydrogenase family protein n=1 Tax=Pseudonocardia eucalypti TaxID=648755 RepID=UPI0017FF2260|nr:alkylation response protein AidB-like acyl-CoA dehydrogenase [Pseudonocardia eucalypti]
MTAPSPAPSPRCPGASLIDRDPDAYLAMHRALDEAVTEALLDGRERSVRDEVRRVAARRVAPVAGELDRTKSFAGDSYQALAEAGLAGLLFPEELGGSADSTVAYAAAMEEVCAACPATSLVYMTQTHAAYPILIGGDAELAERYVPGLLNGSVYGSLAITEPNAGSDVSSLRTTARRDGEEYRINGSKTFITTGDRAGVIVCFATTDRTARRDGVSAFVVEGGSVGLGHGEPLVKMGMHGSSTAELFFDDVRVPSSNRLGAEGSGWRIVMSAVVKSRISAAAQGVGIARGAYAHALAELTRRHGPVLPADLAAPMAELRGRMLQARLLLLTTAAQVDRSEGPPTAAISMMKQQCTDAGVAVATAAVRLLGAAGDLVDLGVERYLRDAKVTQIYDGTNDIQRMLIGRDTSTRMKEASR